MSVRKFTALGTASQVPNTRCNQHGSFLKWDTEGFLFDPGEGTQRQMIHTGISASEITKIFITHFHGDHCLGLPSILQRIALDRVKHPVQIYFPASGQKFFDNIRGVSSYYDTAFIEPHPISQEGVICTDDKLTIRTEQLEHTVETFGYKIEEKDSVSLVHDTLNELGIAGSLVGNLKREGQIDHNGKTVFLKDVSVERKGQSFAFVMDTRVCETANSLAQEVDLLVSESTFLEQDEDKALAYGHLTATQAAEIAREAKVGMLLLTHFSQRYAPPDNDFQSEARKVFPNTIQMKDKMSYVLERSKRLV